MLAGAVADMQPRPSGASSKAAVPRPHGKQHIESFRKTKYRFEEWVMDDGEVMAKVRYKTDDPNQRFVYFNVKPTAATAEQFGRDCHKRHQTEKGRKVTPCKTLKTYLNLLKTTQTCPRLSKL